MKRWYARRMDAWETKLATRSTDRIVRPFEWGLEWTREWPCADQMEGKTQSPEQYFRELNRLAIHDSDRFFGYCTPADFELRSGVLRFTSPVRTPFPENNTVRARWFPAGGEKAVVLLPHWNSPPEGHVALCRGLQRLGISVLRISLPYHDRRMPAELHRADYAVSSNIGRTIDATRQAVIDARCCFDWLAGRGFSRLGIVGTSLGSCYAFLAAAHDPRIAVHVFNHCSAYFGDVVWTGLSSRHIRKSLEGHLDRARLRDLWMAISPTIYLDHFAKKPSRSLFIYTLYDTTFLPEFSRDVLGRIGARGIDHKVVALPCGHYTLGESPFKFVAGWHICSFLKKTL